MEEGARAGDVGPLAARLRVSHRRAMPPCGAAEVPASPWMCVPRPEARRSDDAHAEGEKSTAKAAKRRARLRRQDGAVLIGAPALH